MNENITTGEFLSDGEIVAILSKAYAMTGRYPVVTMGAATKLLAGLPLKRSDDIDIIVDHNSEIFADVRATTSSDGMYSGLKKIVTINGVTVEFLGRFTATVNDADGRRLIIPFVDYPATNMAVLSVNGQNHVVLLTAKDVLEEFYCQANREKDKPKLEALRMSYTRISSTPPERILRALGKTMTSVGEMQAIIRDNFDPILENLSVFTRDPMEGTSTHMFGDAEHYKLVEKRGSIFVQEFQDSEEDVDWDSQWKMSPGDVIEIAGETYLLCDNSGNGWYFMKE